MEVIYLIVLSMITIGVSFCYLPFLILCIEVLALSFIVMFYKRQYLIFMLLILCTFLYRLDNNLHRKELHIGDVVRLEGVINNGIGRIKKIDEKMPIKNLFFSTNGVRDGEVEITGEILNIKKWGKSKKYDIMPEIVDEKERIMKNYFVNKIDEISESYSVDFRNILKGIILGDGDFIDFDLKNKFKYTGSAHLLVISGLHLGVIISFVYIVLKKLKIKKEVRGIVTLGILSFYVLTIGITPSILRAYIMGMIFVLGDVIYEKGDVRKSFGIAFILSVFLYPGWLYNVSFLMSYVAVFAIIFIYPKIPKIKEKNWKGDILNNISLILVIQVCMSPIFIIYFSSLPLFAFLSNLVLIPIGSLFIVLSFVTLLLSNINLHWLISPFTYFIYTLFIESMEIISKIPYLTLEI